MKLDLNSLLVFFEVVNAESVSKAARNLELPKSTVSRKIKHLESQIGSPLLRRGHRKIAVTEEGQRLHEHCARIALEVEHAGLGAAENRGSLAGRLRVSLPIDFGTAWLSYAVASFCDEFPSIALEIHVNGRWVDVSEEAYDIAIHLGDPGETGLPYRRFSTMPRGLYASPEYLAHRPASPALEDHMCVFTEQQLAEGIWVDSHGEPLARRHARIIVNNIGVARDLVVRGIGVGILPTAMCRNDVRNERLVELQPAQEIPALQAFATFFSGHHVPRRISAFLDYMSNMLSGDGGEQS
jgi:DNA-binding transcriptional LysR family regulator